MRVEVDVLDPADVGAVVDLDAPAQAEPEDISDVVQLVMPAEGNAVVLGNTPNYDRWNRTLERSVLDASGEAVGLPEGQMGNSEVGHLNLGAGRIVYHEAGEMFEITVDMTTAGESIGIYKTFQIEVKPPVGSALIIERTAPAALDAVMILH